MQQNSSSDGWVQEAHEPYTQGGDGFLVEDHRTRRFILVDYPVIDHLPDIGKNAFITYCALVRFANRDRKAWPSWKSLQKRTGLGREALRKALRILQHFCFIKVEQGRRGGNFSSNVYLLPDLTDWHEHPDKIVRTATENGNVT